MAYASSKMSVAELDALYTKALANEAFINHCDNLIDDAMNDRDDDFWLIPDDICREWTNEDEAALEQYEIDKRERLAIKNEY